VLSPRALLAVPTASTSPRRPSLPPPRLRSLGANLAANVTAAYASAAQGVSTSAESEVEGYASDHAVDDERHRTIIGIVGNRAVKWRAGRAVGL
jgi:hypothetical protein